MKNLSLTKILLVALLMMSSAVHAEKMAEKNILVFGDSLSAGYGIARDASWVNLLQQELRRSHPQFGVVNASISGETAAGGLRRIAKAKVLLVGMRLPPNYGKAYVDEFQNTFAQLAKKHRVALLPFLLDGVTAEQFQADNLHPDSDAQTRIMGNVLQALRPLF
jgi:acyl-CoA thioesterase-1